VLQFSQSWANRFIPNFRTSEGHHWLYTSLQKASDVLLRFETTASQMQNFALFNPCVKIRGRVGQISKSVFRAIIYAPETCFRFPICCSVSKLEPVKGDWFWESRPNFALFDPPPVKIRGGGRFAKCFRLTLWRHLGTNHWYTFDGAPLRRLAAISVRGKNSSEVN